MNSVIFTVFILVCVMSAAVWVAFKIMRSVNSAPAGDDFFFFEKLIVLRNEF